MLRVDALQAIYPEVKDRIVVTIMGAVAAELYTIGHRPNFFYLEHAMGLASSMGLGIALAHVAAVADEHQQWNFVEQCQRDDRVDGCEEAMVLHQQRGIDTCEMRSGGDADRLLFLGDAYQRDVGVVIGHADEVHQPGLRKSGNDLHIAGFEGIVDNLGVGE